MTENMMKQQLFKTKVCRHFMSGRCKYGQGCTFAHSAVELQTRPDFRRTKLCSKINCQDGSCGYAHSAEDIRDAICDVICPLWLAGNCGKGQGCPLSHNATHIEELAVAYRLVALGNSQRAAIDQEPANNINVHNSNSNSMHQQATPVATPTALYADALLASLHQLLTLNNAASTGDYSPQLIDLSKHQL